MNSLAQLQKQFQQHLLSGDNTIANEIVTTEKIQSEVRLNIYRHAYHARLEECLGNTFSCLKCYLGDEAFHELSLAYIEAHPSPFRSIRWFGDKLSEFVSDYFEADYHYLAELAHFEWQLTLCFDAENAIPCTLSDMIAIPPMQWAEMKLKVQPSFLRIDFFGDAVTLWEALRNDEEIQIPEHYQQPAPWILWRQDYLNRFYALEADEAWAIDAMLKGEPFGKLCEGLCQWHSEETVSLRAASLLKRWVEAGMIAKILI